MNTADLLGAIKGSSDEIQQSILDMAGVMNSPTATSEEKQAAKSTLAELVARVMGLSTADMVRMAETNERLAVMRAETAERERDVQIAKVESVMFSWRQVEERLLRERDELRAKVAELEKRVAGLIRDAKRRIKERNEYHAQARDIDKMRQSAYDRIADLEGELHDCPVCHRKCKECDCMEKRIADLERQLAAERERCAKLRAALESSLIFIQNVKVPKTLAEAELQVRSGEATISEGIAAIRSSTGERTVQPREEKVP